ncbi:transposase, partial [Candidatus Magnetobacterium bavaricum]
MTASMTIDGGIDNTAVMLFTNKVLCPTLRPGNVVIMDNLSSHKSKNVEEAIN